MLTAIGFVFLAFSIYTTFVVPFRNKVMPLREMQKNMLAVVVLTLFLTAPLSLLIRSVNTNTGVGASYVSAIFSEISPGDSVLTVDAGRKNLVVLVALPGQMVEARDGALWVDGRRLVGEGDQFTHVEDNCEFSFRVPQDAMVVHFLRPQLSCQALAPVPLSTLNAKRIFIYSPLSQLGSSRPAFKLVEDP